MTSLMPVKLFLVEIINFFVHASLFQQQSIKNYWYFKDRKVNLLLQALLAKYANRDGTDNYNGYINFSESIYCMHQSKKSIDLLMFELYIHYWL